MENFVARTNKFTTKVGEVPVDYAAWAKIKAEQDQLQEAFMICLGVFGEEKRDQFLEGEKGKPDSVLKKIHWAILDENARQLSVAMTKEEQDQVRSKINEFKEKVDAVIGSLSKVELKEEKKEKEEKS